MTILCKYHEGNGKSTLQKDKIQLQYCANTMMLTGYLHYRRRKNN